jgi:hypothetical protein
MAAGADIDASQLGYLSDMGPGAPQNASAFAKTCRTLISGAGGGHGGMYWEGCCHCIFTSSHSRELPQAPAQ